MQEAARKTNAFYESFLNAGVGVSRRTALILDNNPSLDPDIAPCRPVYGLSQLPASEVPFGFAYGWSFQTMLVDTRVFMPFLVQMVLDSGTSISLRTIQTRADLLALPHSIIANCTGLGARELVGDDTVYPVKGQLVTVNPLTVTDLVVHGSDYVFTRGDSAILGGTNEPHVEDVTPSEAVTQGIIDRNQSIVPSLDRSQVTNVRAGLRPFREDGPRIEAEPAGEKVLLHNYGHGGGGWSLAPGCAELLYSLLP
jgi:D-amino-acid oxidase